MIYMIAAMMVLFIYLIYIGISINRNGKYTNKKELIGFVLVMIIVIVLFSIGGAKLQYK